MAILTRGDIRYPLYALTWWQPWGWAMFHGKTVENRTWHPPARMKGQVLAIHAGKHFEADAVPVIDARADERCPRKAEIALGAIIGVARLVGSYDWREKPPQLPRPPASASCGCGGITHRDTCPFLSPWFFGPVGWLFEDALEFAEPIPCRGSQGLWRVEEPALIQKVLAAVDAAPGHARSGPRAGPKADAPGADRLRAGDGIAGLRVLAPGRCRASERRPEPRDGGHDGRWFPAVKGSREGAGARAPQA